MDTPFSTGENTNKTLGVLLDEVRKYAEAEFGEDALSQRVHGFICFVTIEAKRPEAAMSLATVQVDEGNAPMAFVIGLRSWPAKRREMFTETVEHCDRLLQLGAQSGHVRMETRDGEVLHNHGYTKPDSQYAVGLLERYKQAVNSGSETFVYDDETLHTKFAYYLLLYLKERGQLAPNTDIPEVK